MITKSNNHVLTCITQSPCYPLMYFSSHLSFLYDFMYNFMYYFKISTQNTTCVFSNQSSLYFQRSLINCKPQVSKCGEQYNGWHLPFLLNDLPDNCSEIKQISWSYFFSLKSFSISGTVVCGYLTYPITTSTGVCHKITLRIGVHLCLINKCCSISCFAFEMDNFFFSVQSFYVKKSSFLSCPLINEQQNFVFSRYIFVEEVWSGRKLHKRLLCVGL